MRGQSSSISRTRARCFANWTNFTLGGLQFLSNFDEIQHPSPHDAFEVGNQFEVRELRGRNPSRLHMLIRPQSNVIGPARDGARENRLQVQTDAIVNPEQARSCNRETGFLFDLARETFLERLSNCQMAARQ